MPAPYPQFIFDFTSARGVAMHLGPTEAKALIEHLEGQVSGNDDLTSEIVKEIYLFHSMMLTLPGLPDVQLSDAVAGIKPHAARGLVAALTGDGVVLSAEARTLLETVTRVHNISPMDKNQARDALLVCSVVYTLPRMTAAVGTVSEHLIATWTELSSDTQQEIRSLVSEAIKAGRTGAEIDTRGWIAVIDHAEGFDSAVQPSL
jgi:hypothetical protein